MYAILIVILVLILLGGLPNVGIVHHNYGYGPSGFAGLLVIVLLILILTGRP